MRYRSNLRRIRAAGGEAIAELLERSNSPSTHKNVAENIMRAERPSNIDHVVDRSKVPPGGTRINELIKHQLQCMGVEFHYEDGTEGPPTIYPEES
mgnify:CR=1 FL=1